MKKIVVVFLLAFSNLCFSQTIISNHPNIDTVPLIAITPANPSVLESDEIHLNVFPNPTSANATLQLNLRTTQYLIIDLTDTNGNIIRTISSQMFNNLEQSVFIETYGIGTGTYLISIKSEGGFLLCSKVLKVER